MKKIGFVIFIIAILIGVVFANLFSFGRVSGKIFSFSIGSSVKGSGVTRSEVRNQTGFKGVDVGGVFEVEIVAGKDFAVEVEADDNLLPFIKTEVEDGVLHIRTSENIKSQNSMRLRIAAPDIESLEASGASKVSLEGVNNTSLKVDTSGASKLRIAGDTGSLEVEVSGAGKIDAESLKAKSATVDASGASHVSVYATERLVTDASGASKIEYSGNPASVRKNTSGVSSVHQN